MTLDDTAKSIVGGRQCLSMVPMCSGRSLLKTTTPTAVVLAIRMSNGETHEVRHPECLIEGANRAVVSYPNDDRFVFCALLHINAVEALQATPRGRDRRA